MKNRIRRCDPQKQSHWEAVLGRWKESGRSVRDFCQAEGLRESALYFWRRELARRSQTPLVASATLPEVSGPVPLASGPKQRSSPRRSPASFLPVRVVQDAAGEATCGIEIVLACGRRVRVGTGFDRQTLASVLAVLEAQPC